MCYNSHMKKKKKADVLVPTIMRFNKEDRAIISSLKRELPAQSRVEVVRIAVRKLHEITK